MAAQELAKGLTSELSGGFSNPPIDAAFAFRAVMDAMARPGRVKEIAGAVAPAPLSVAAATLVLTLCDNETPIYLAGGFDTEAVRRWIAFHTGASFVGPANCLFALGQWDDLLPLSAYGIGTPQYPDRSATLIIEWPHLAEQDGHGGAGATLTGPGIEKTASLNLPDVDQLQANHRLYPLGLDFLFTCGAQIAALPRSTSISQPSPNAQMETC